MSWITTPSLWLAEQALNLAAVRHSLIAGNMANIDTPHFHTRDIDFQGELRRALMEIDSENLSPVVRDVQGLMERPDGNNVSLEREGLALADAQLRYRLGVEILRSEFRRLSVAINEGK